MIGKISKGRGFFGCLSYVLGKEGAKILDGNVMGNEPSVLARQFRFCCQANRRVERTVFHATLATSSAEPLDEATWRALARDYLSEMEFNDVPYLLVKHSDTAHHHVHIVAGRVRADGSCVSDKYDYHRSFKAIRRLEQHYKLSSPPSKKITTYQPQPEEVPSYAHLQATLTRLCQKDLSILEWVRLLQEEQVNVVLHRTRRSKEIRGIRFEYQGDSFTGSELSSDYTWPALKRYFAAQASDETALRSMTEPKTQATYNPQVQQQRLDALAPVAERLLQQFQTKQIKGRKYQLYRYGDTFYLKRNRDNSKVFKATCHLAGWKPIKTPNINDEDLKNFEILLRQLTSDRHTEQGGSERVIRKNC